MEWKDRYRFSLNAEADKAYAQDNTFRTLVDTLRTLLQAYQFTPLELRQAAMLASTMHETERIRPLSIVVSPPDMFGGTVGSANTAAGVYLNRRSRTGDRRKRDINAGNISIGARIGKYDRHQALYSSTARKPNGDRRFGAQAHVPNF